jgi:hypothetical protein
VQGSWSSPVTNKLLLEAGATVTPQDFHGYRRAGVPLTQFAVSDALAPAGYPTTWGSSTTYGANRSTQSNYRAGASYVTGSHVVKAGFTLMHSWRYATQEPNNSVSLTLRSGVPFADGARHADPVPRDDELQRRPLRAGSVAPELADYELRRRPTCSSHRDEQQIGAGPFTPARLREIENVPNGKTSIHASARRMIWPATARSPSRSIGRYVVAESCTPARSTPCSPPSTR